MSLPTLPADKANHAIYGVLVFTIVYLVLHHTRLLGAHPHVAMALVFVAAVGKELDDWLANQSALARGQLPPHSAELADVLATCAGGAICYAIAVTA